jgi:hypothetical protein
MAFLMKIAVAGGTGLTRRNRVAGLAEYCATHGNLGALIAARDLDDERAEVITLRCWPSMDAIRGFAGNECRAGGVLPAGQPLPADQA